MTKPPAMPEPLGWYVVNNIGMATLCSDKQDATQVAVENSIQWPNLAPHRAMQLCDAGALQSAQPAGHSCVFHAAPLTPGETRGPQFAVCAICGQPPRVLATQPAAPQGVIAWAHPDGRVVPASTKEHSSRDGGAMASSLAGYTIPCVAAQPAAAVSDEEIDAHLDLILRAAGSALRHYTLPKSIDDLRAALRSAILALRPQAVPMTDAPVAYFSYGEDSGYLEHVTAEDASKHAREEITAYRSDAMHDNEWPSEVDSVCWGVVLQKATAVDNSEEAGRESFDYELGPHHGITQRADAAHQPNKEPR